MVPVDQTGTWINVSDERRLARAIDTRFIELRDYRMWYEWVWRRLYELVIPEREAALSWYNNNFGASASGSDYRSVINNIGNKIFDMTALNILQLLVAGIQGYHVGRQDNWFALSLPHPDMMNLQGVRKWLQEVELWLYEVLQDSNFYDQLGPFLIDGIGTGTATQYVELDDMGNQVHSTIHPLNIYIDVDHLQRVDTVYRVLSLTRRQAIQKFGADRLSRNILENRRSTSEFKFIHAVFPRSDTDPEMGLHYRQFGSALESEAPYISVYKEMADFSRSGERYGFSDSRDSGVRGRGPADRGDTGYDRTDRVTQVGGLWEFPYFCWRWDVDSENTYGISPFHKLLPNVKQINDYGKLLKKATIGVTEPPWMVPINMRGRPQLGPNGVNLMLSSADRIEPITRQMANYPYGVDREDRMVRQLREATGVDFFILLSQLSQSDKHQRTATEIWELQAEKAAVLSSQIGRLNTDALSKMVGYTFYQQRIRGNTPPMPPALERFIGTGYGHLKLGYRGPLAQAQRHLQMVQGPLRGIEQIGIIGQLAPESMDKINFDELMGLLAEHSLPAKVLNSALDVQRIRETRAQREAQQQRLDQMEQAAKAYRNAGGAETLGAGAGQEALGLPAPGGV